MGIYLNLHEILCYKNHNGHPILLMWTSICSVKLIELCNNGTLVKYMKNSDSVPTCNVLMNQIVHLNTVNCIVHT